MLNLSWISEHKAFSGLLVGHLLVGIAAPPLVMHDDLFWHLFIGLVACQASLLGAWLGLAQFRALVRVIGLAVGIPLLFVQLGIGIQELTPLAFIFVAVANLSVAVSARIVSRWAVVERGQSTEQAGEGLQYSIRHLFLFTFVVACLLALGRVLSPTLPNWGHATRVALLSLNFAAVALAAIWATLGSRSSLLRILVVLLLAAGAGTCGGFVIDGRHNLEFWIIATIVQAGLLIVSLWILRLDGFRLVRRPTTDLT